MYRDKSYTLLERSSTFPITALGSVSYECTCSTATPQCWNQAVIRPSEADSRSPKTRALSEAYVRHASQWLNFEEEVVKQRCPEKLPYKPRYFYEAVNVRRIQTPRPLRKPRGRCSAAGHVSSHETCCLTNQIMCPRKLRPIDCRSPPKKPRRKKKKESVDEVCKMENWDVYAMSLLSKCTAEWIINVLPGANRKELRDYVNARYGQMMSVTDLASPKASIDVFDTELKLLPEPPKWTKQGDIMVDKVRKLVAAEGLTTPEDDDDNEDSFDNIAFYRLPAGIRRARKAKRLEEDDPVNQTAQDIRIPARRDTEMHILSLSDYLNPRVGEKIFDTTNPFQHERLTGLQQVKDSHNADDNVIVTESDSRYHKQLQPLLPRPPDNWAHSEDKVVGPKRVRRMVGTQKWSDLPQLIMPEFQDPTSRKSRMSRGTTTLTVATKPQDERQLNNSLVAIVNDWRTKWSLDMRYADATPEDLIRDMADLQLHVRLKAITTCARAAEYRPPPGPGIPLETEPINQMSLLPENLFVALECCLRDAHEQVRRAAAIALYTLERPTTQAEQVLRHSLLTAASVDRWAAAQCLAFYGECDSDVVGELISQLMTAETAIRHEQAAHLLSLLSESSTLVHSMIGEQLNSSSWRERVMACQLIPRLSGCINKDLVSKMLQLLWSDWHCDVRHVAGQALGRTAHGRHVHDSLLVQLDVGNEKTKVLAINHIGCLGIMTAKLLPIFLESFDSSYVSIRSEACIAAARLSIRDEHALAKLVQLATFDPVWKVKATALQAFRQIGVLTPAIRACILWAFRYEAEEGVRAEACRCLIDMRINDEQTVQTLQDRDLVEDSVLVKNEIAKALGVCNISPSEDIAMVLQIKNEVRKLSTVDNIFRNIVTHEKDIEKEANMQRLVKEPKEQAHKGQRSTQKAASLSAYGEYEQISSQKSIPRPEQPTPVQIQHEPILSPLRVVKDHLSPVREMLAVADEPPISEDDCAIFLEQSIMEEDETVADDTQPIGEERLTTREESPFIGDEEKRYVGDETGSVGKETIRSISDDETQTISEETQSIGEELLMAEEQQISSGSRAVTAATFTPVTSGDKLTITPRLCTPAGTPTVEPSEPEMVQVRRRRKPRYLLPDEIPTRTPACGYVPPAAILASVAIMKPHDNSEQLFALCKEIAKDHPVENVEFDAMSVRRNRKKNIRISTRSSKGCNKRK